MNPRLPHRNEAVIRARIEGARRRHEKWAPYTRSARILEAAAELADESGRLDRDDLMRAMEATSRKERDAIGDLICHMRRRHRWPYEFRTKTLRVLDAAAELADESGRLRRADLMRAMGASTDHDRRSIDGLICGLRKQGNWPYTYASTRGVRDRLADLRRLLDAMTDGERSAAADLVRARTT